MNRRFLDDAPGFYQYTYPTFVDTPQLICVHFLTPDGQQAFVSYPRHPNRKAAQLIPVSWFEGVELVPLAGHPGLMPFLESFLTDWCNDGCFELGVAYQVPTRQAAYGFGHQQAA